MAALLLSSDAALLLAICVRFGALTAPQRTQIACLTAGPTVSTIRHS
jgi:hypothetical protein